MLKVLTANIRRFPLLSFYIVLFIAPALSSNDYDDKSRRKEYLKLMRAYEEFEAQVNGELKQAFVMIDKFSEEEIKDRDANASKIEDSEGYMAKLTELLGNVEMTLEALLPAAYMPSPEMHEGRADVPQSTVSTKLNTTANFSCESNGMPLSFCIWTHAGKAQEIMNKDGEIRLTEDGVVYSSAGLNGGKCSVVISKIKKIHLGKWDCTLVANNGKVFTAAVAISIEVSVYFVTAGGEVKVFSPNTRKIETVTVSSQGLCAIAYDTIRNKLYWTNWNHLYRCDASSCGTSVETVLTATYHGTLWGLGFDYVTGNIYIVSSEGYIMACDGSPSLPFNCAILLSGEHELRGIALNPTSGLMYWTQYPAHGDASIFRCEMDGSNARRIISDLELPCGIVIDFESSRLYWADDRGKRIESSDMEGRSRHVVLSSLPKGPFGLALAYGRLYWGYYSSQEVQSSTKDGRDIRIEYNGSANMRHFAMSPWNASKDRTNHCEKTACEYVCVLTRSSSRCVDRYGNRNG